MCAVAVELPYMESRLAAVSAYLPSCFSDYTWSRPHTTQLKPVVRLLCYMEALLSGLTAWLPRELGSRDRRVGGKESVSRSAQTWREEQRDKEEVIRRW